MIVEAMSYLEAYNQIESDLPKVKIWADKFLPRVTKDFGKDRAFPKYHIEKYTHEFDFIYLTPLEGPLVEAGPEHAVYYRAWRKDGKFYFEFVNNDRTKKAINNRTSIIEPFCEKVESSKSPDDSEMIATITPGLLNDDYTVIDKAKIEYK